jgi:hypothetical protein
MQCGTVETRVRSLVWNMCAAVHGLSLESGNWHALQDNRNLSDMRQSQERVSNLLARFGIWSPNTSSRHGTRASKRRAYERHQPRILRTEHGEQGPPYHFVLWRV